MSNLCVLGFVLGMLQSLLFLILPAIYQVDTTPAILWMSTALRGNKSSPKLGVSCVVIRCSLSMPFIACDHLILKTGNEARHHMAHHSYSMMPPQVLTFKHEH